VGGDFNTMCDRATFGESDMISEGMKFVFVNIVVVEEGKFNSAAPGQVLRGPGYNKQ
jgi:hypothetical protein